MFVLQALNWINGIFVILLVLVWPGGIYLFFVNQRDGVAAGFFGLFTLLAIVGAWRLLQIRMLRGPREFRSAWTETLGSFRDGKRYEVLATMDGIGMLGRHSFPLELAISAEGIGISCKLVQLSQVNIPWKRIARLKRIAIDNSSLVDVLLNDNGNQRRLILPWRADADQLVPTSVALV